MPKAFRNSCSGLVSGCASSTYVFQVTVLSAAKRSAKLLRSVVHLLGFILLDQVEIGQFVFKTCVIEQKADRALRG